MLGQLENIMQTHSDIGGKISALTKKKSRRVGKYEIGISLGEGTFGKVKKAVNVETGEVVAMVTVFVHTDHQYDMSVLMTMLNTGETCVLAYGRELDWYTPKENSNYYNGVFLSNL